MCHEFVEGAIDVLLVSKVPEGVNGESKESMDESVQGVTDGHNKNVEDRLRNVHDNFVPYNQNSYF